MVGKIQNGMKIFVQDGARMEREGTWRCLRGCAGRYNGSIGVEGFWVIQILVPWKLEG